MHRGEKIKKILLALADGALATMEILDELWPTGFTRSHYTNRKRAFRNKTFDFAQEQEFYNLLSYLKRHGLIEKKNNGNRTFWKITADGLNKLLKIKEKALDYESQSDGKLKIVIDANGCAYPCSSLNDKFKALNVKEVGVKKAYEHILKINTCEACYFLTQNDWSLLLGLSGRQYREQMKIQLRQIFNRY